MPRWLKPKKDVEDGDTRRGVVNKWWSDEFRMEKSLVVKAARTAVSQKYFKPTLPSLEEGRQIIILIIINIFAKQRWETRGSETSQYPEEKKSKEIP